MDRTVYAGQSLKVELEVSAEPKPELIVNFPEGQTAEGREARTSSQVDADFGVATFHLKEVSRADAGNYNFVVKNSQGDFLCAHHLFLTFRKKNLKADKKNLSKIFKNSRIC